MWGDYQTADPITCRVPLIVHGPEIQGGRVDAALHYQYDWGATLVELAGGRVPATWDGVPFTTAFQAGQERGRPYLVTSQNVWACQKGVRFERYVCLRTYHDGYKQLAPVMLFDVEADPHEQCDVAGERPDMVARAMALLAEWSAEVIRTSRRDVDPMVTVLREGGPLYTRGQLPAYLQRLRDTGRTAHAERLAAQHREEL